MKPKLWDKWCQPSEYVLPDDYWDYQFTYKNQSLRVFHVHKKEGNTEFVTEYIIMDGDLSDLNKIAKCYQCEKPLPKELLINFKLSYVRNKYEI